MGISSDLGRLEKGCRFCHFGPYVTLQVLITIQERGRSFVFALSLHHHNHHHQYRQILFHLRSQFHAIWGSHKCEVKGCGLWLTCDGGMKPRRYLNCIFSNLNEFVLFQQCVRCEVQWSQDIQTQCHKGGIRLHAETQPWPSGSLEGRGARTLSNIICSSVLIISTTRVQWCWQKISRRRQRPS